MKISSLGLFVILVLLPIAEISLLMTLGGIIGVIPTILAVILTAVVGANLVRSQGFELWQRLQRELAQGQMPTQALMEGMMILAGGLLLLTPGFITDLMGLLCLLPVSRIVIIKYLMRQFADRFSQAQTSKPFSNHQTTTLEGEFKRDLDAK
jgi:UPF0716 protein FxsA